jgi:hypothetical protein
MTISVQCECGKKYNTGTANAGKRFACKQCGKEVAVPGGAQDDIAATITWVQEQREAGHTRGALREQLITHGYSEDEAHKLVDTALGTPDQIAARHGASRRARSRATDGESAYGGEGGGGEGAGWMIWIGILLVINLLSWIFDWPFWIY